jgi:hypothetical protein
MCGELLEAADLSGTVSTAIGAWPSIVLTIAAVSPG